MNILKRIFCKHEWEFFQNLYGDHIIWSGLKRTEYICPKCGATKFYDEFIHEKFKWNEL